MAVTNTLGSVLPLIFAGGLKALRRNAVMPSLVNSDWGTDVKQKGDTIRVPLPSSISVTDVVPAAIAPDSGNIAPAVALIPLSYWKEAAFTLTEKELAQIVTGIVPIQVSAAVEAISGFINATLLGLYTNVYGYVGTAGTTPFATDVTAATQARKVLGIQLAPTNNRRLVIDPAAEANALALPAFYGALNTGTTDVIKEGYIGRKFGMDWHMDQQVLTQVAGAFTGTVTANGAQAAGSTSVSIATAAASSFAPNVGDIISFSGDAQTYVVSAGAALGASGAGPFVIAPAKVVALVGGEVVTMRASHLVNMAFHRDAFAFASRPLMSEDLTANADEEFSVPDPVSGVTMRLTYRKEYHRTRLAFDVLFGVGCIRPQLACRIAG